MKMKFLAYWQNLNEREQLTLALGGVFAACYLFYLVIYSPLTTAVATNTQQLQENRETLAWMQKIQREYRHPSTVAQPIDNSKLLSLIATELSKPTFKEFTYQMQQTGTADIQLSFDKVPYNAFLNWLWEITHHYTVHIKELHIERTGTAGVVKLNLLMFT